MDYAFEISYAVIVCNAQTRTKQQMLSHYRVVHRGDADFKAPCFECEKTILDRKFSKKTPKPSSSAAVIPALEVPSVNKVLTATCSLSVHHTHQPILSSKICILQTISMILAFIF
ncbi:hypothetical protein OUZ56_016195 [Daphnia magna]|uniref:C2H2-type domain-containing protein n=1 Tax=Daphnia magna TaxID=35525 RepID=A0ABR0APZ3_9CRUS|nr:hypothetical protein OUZ56_016195 [Daphnia magna]